MTDDFKKHWLQLPEPAVEFFAYFSRFEFALKQAGYFENDSDDADAKPGWNCFARDLDHPFFDEMNVASKTKVLFDKPPQKQIVKNGGVGWKDMDHPTGAQQLFEAVRRVRNNLFHGGKSSTLHSDPVRDEALLNACLFILKKALKKCGEQQPPNKLRKVVDEFNARP